MIAPAPDAIPSTKKSWQHRVLWAEIIGAVLVVITAGLLVLWGCRGR